jgi:hypothetical protein
MPIRMTSTARGVHRTSLVGFGLAVTICVGLSGCGMGALPSSYNGPVTGSIAAANAQAIAAASTGLSEIHPSTCPGLDIERTERLRRIVQWQKSMTAELSSAPTTLAHAVLRASSTPEEGTNAYKEIMAERAYLASVATAAAKLGCPPVDAAKDVPKG